MPTVINENQQRVAHKLLKFLRPHTHTHINLVILLSSPSRVGKPQCCSKWKIWSWKQGDRFLIRISFVGIDERLQQPEAMTGTHVILGRNIRTSQRWEERFLLVLFHLASLSLITHSPNIHSYIAPSHISSTFMRVKHVQSTTDPSYLSLRPSRSYPATYFASYNFTLLQPGSTRVSPTYHFHVVLQASSC